MSINSVSFRAGDFSTKIQAEQKYKAQPAAASGVKGNESAQGGKGKKVVGGLLVTAALVAAALGFAAKKKPECKLFQFKIGEYAIGDKLKSAGDWIAKNATKVKDNVLNFFKTLNKEKVAETVEEGAEKATETVADVVS